MSGRTIPDDAAAVTDGAGRVTTRSELRRLVTDVEASLHTLGAAPGATIATTLPSGVELLALAMAAARRDVAIAPVPPSWWPAEAAAALAELAPALVVTGARGDDRLAVANGAALRVVHLTPDGALRAGGTPGVHGPRGAPGGGPGTDDPPAIDLRHAPAGWSATSGAYGPGRLVRHHPSVVPPPPTALAVATHPAAAGLLGRLVRAAEAGEPVVVVTGPLTPGAVHRAAAAGAEQLWAAPHQLDRLADQLRRAGTRPAPAPAGIGIVAFGAPLQPSTAATVRDRLGVTVEVRYTLAELGGTLARRAAVYPDDLASGPPPRPATDPDPDADLAVALAVGPSDDGWELATDERPAAGLAGPSPTLVARRRDRPDAVVGTDDVVVPGGAFRLRGPSAAAFTVDGETVHPAEVEHVLARHPGVASVTVVARPDPARGSFGVAVVVPADREHPPFLDDLVEGADLSATARPAALTLVDHVRLTSAGVPHQRFLRYEEARRQQNS